MMTFLVVYCLNNDKKHLIPIAVVLGFVLDILMAKIIVNGLS